MNQRNSVNNEDSEEAMSFRAKGGILRAKLNREYVDSSSPGANRRDDYPSLHPESNF